ncbi:hypothetical protein XENOCAPTIV_000515 [Xenoophorus captivus]|uniref:Uncharacterized protein n=1 Tax=Xenoophorus captivus TaxID=1517983 RepID=A0ABV0S784_9TELE
MALNNSMSVKVGCYILIGVGAFSMLMGFVGCLGAIYEIRCLLGLYFTCLLLILIAQIAAGALIYFQKEVGCSESVESWLITNLGVVLGICLGVAFIEVRWMVPSSEKGHENHREHV